MHSSNNGSEFVCDRARFGIQPEPLTPDYATW